MLKNQSPSICGWYNPFVWFVGYLLHKKTFKKVTTSERISRQNINLQKIEIMGSNVSIEIIEEFASGYSWKNGEWPNMYLGLPLKGNHKSFSFLEDYYRKNRKVINMVIMLYFERRTLIQATLSNLPTYYMSLFEMSQKVATDIERSFRNYLWKDDMFNGIS